MLMKKKMQMLLQVLQLIALQSILLAQSYGQAATTTGAKQVHLSGMIIMAGRLRHGSHKEARHATTYEDVDVDALFPHYGR